MSVNEIHRDIEKWGEEIEKESKKAPTLIKAYQNAVDLICANNQDINDLKAQVKELKEKLSLYEWRDIKDVPPIDGSDFLATDGDDVFTVCFHKDGFALSTLDEIVDGGGSPYHIEPRYPHITHWMKMPTPPSTQEGEE